MSQIVYSIFNTPPTRQYIIFSVAERATVEELQGSQDGTNGRRDARGGYLCMPSQEVYIVEKLRFRPRVQL